MFLSSLYTEDTEVFTERGWVPFSGVKLNDKVYSRNESTGRGEWVDIIRRASISVNEDLVHLTGVSNVSNEESLDLLVISSTDIYVSISAPGVGGVKRILEAGKIHELLCANEIIYVFTGARIKNNKSFLEQFKDLEHKASQSGKDVQFHSRVNLLDMSQVVIISDNKTKLVTLENFLTLAGYQAMLRDNCIEAYSEPMCLLSSSLVHYQGEVWGIELQRNRMFLVRRNGYPCFSGDCILD